MTTRWDIHFLRLARECSRMSKDPSTKVGAVIVKDRRVFSTGFNGFAPGVADDHRLNDRAKKYALVIHAEMNAIIYAGRESQGATLYLWGFEGAPCANCAKHLAAAGVVRVVASGPPIPERWADSLAEAERILYEADVGIRYYHRSEVEEL